MEMYYILPGFFCVNICPVVQPFFIYLFVSSHEVHSTNTHTLQNAG